MSTRGAASRCRLALALVIVIAAAGCGLRLDSHAVLQAKGAAGPAAIDAGTGRQADAAGTDLGGTGTAMSSSPAAAAGSATSGASGRAAPPQGPGSGPTSRVSSAVASKAPILLGFQVTANLGAAFAASGASGSAPAEEDMVNALVRWVNDTGGINGRKLQIVLHRTDITAGSFASQAAEACADFTQDHHVLAVASSPVDASDDLLTCLAQHETPDVEQGLWPYDDTYYRRFPGLLYQPGRASPSRWGKVYVDVLNERKWFDGATVGLMRFDAPVYDRMAEVIRGEMTRTGHHFAKEVAIATPGSLSDLGAMSGAINNAIVQFRSAGVDHVMFAASGELPFFFLSEAESQHYRPKYGLSSNDVPATQVGRGAPSAQLANAVAVGWQPANDTGDDNFRDKNPAMRQCAAIMKKYGVPASGFYSDSHCDSMFFLRRLLTQLTTFSVPALREAAQRLGSSFDSPLTFATHFGPRLDGAATARFATYSTAAGCFQYVGPNHPM